MSLRAKFDTHQWAQENFQGCDLGDKRRERRLEKFARQAADRPAASLPKIGENWGGAKGIYRLLDRPEATLTSVTETHRGLVNSQTGQRYLMVSDTTHVDMGWQRNLDDAGPIGPGRGKGFLLHSTLKVDADDESLIGLAGQTAHTRPKKRRGRQNASKRKKRWRESEMWIEVIEQIGSPREGSQYIHICDSAADNYEVFCAVKQLDSDFVIRVGRQHRKVVVNGRQLPLSQAISGLEEGGRYELEIGRGNGRKARTALLRVAWQAVELPAPAHPSSRIKRYFDEDGADIPAWVVVVEEIDPPNEVEPIRWILLTTLPVDSFDDAWEIISWYENRWLVEEWHKALKTGCRLESRQLQSVDRLKPLTGVLSVVAVLLVQLKTAARIDPDGKASDMVPPLWLQLLHAKGKIKTRDVTNYEFWRGLAKLGGFLGRTHDGEPGWQTIWSGWQDLHTMAEGAQLAK